MLYLLIKALLSGAIVAAVSEVAKRYPGFGGLIASLPLVSVLGMIWLWRVTGDADRLAAHARTPAGETGLHLAVDCGDDLAALRVVKAPSEPSRLCHVPSAWNVRSPRLQGT